MSIYTKTGDAGETGLYTGERVRKSSLRVAAYGTVDELDSVLGLARASVAKAEVRERVLALQKKLPALMADLASRAQEAMIAEADVAALEQAMDELEGRLPPLTSFLVPGDTQGGAALDHARTVTRRAERLFCRLAEEEEVHDTDRRYLNRLSDYCFLLMRLEEQ
ncbi:cob(I)yrinic acid a,c-diamide adenosyltransferase [Selenomonas bovis]|jgi:cob(I)alamin adenosyltransferase|uniref:cob(I)yrinic acid a,c-diamide adenosyltransferase n=1 Tax=Selenomonas bovis TaxID=416586 RepID=UPI0004E12937|nr:cob(I)yrinic acid a,c-diamide adenosyltransferase [Selenomonas bovis]MDY6299454.1 cob(I)yrinic acid a,c-diamide adenosyltransferase [Selenomonadaceae bacterium]